VDFLGFNVRRYRGKLLIKPSKAAVKRIRARLTAEMRALRGHNAQMVLIRLNPIIRGWSAYYRHAVSARVFNELDSHVWKLTYKWANFTHPHKGKRWITSRYFGAFNSSRRDRWVFGDRDSGAYLIKFAWTKITRHTLVKGWASPDDPALTDYWAARRRRGRPPLDRARLTACPQTAWTLPALWRAAAARRYRAATPRRLGTVDHSDQQGDPSPRGDRRRGARVIGLHRIPSHPHALSAPPARRLCRCASTLQPRLTSLRGLLEPVAWKAGTAGS
jgi:hypothetical protein